MLKTVGRRAPISFSSLAQKPLYPGLGPRIRSFDGDHVYSHSAQNVQALKESAAWIVTAAAALAPVIGYTVFGASLTAFGPAAAAYPAYISATAGILRIIAKGKSNTIRKDLTGKTVLLLGGTGEIGRYVARDLLEMGATVVIASHSTPEKVEKVKSFLKEASEKVLEPTEDSNASHSPQDRLYFKKIELEYLSSIRFFTKSLKEEHPSIHIIINCSGVMYEDEKLSKYGDEEQLATNALGPYLLIESLLPSIRETRGRIVHVASSALVTCSDKVVKSYLSHKGGLWNPNDPNHKFDGIEQYGFTKLCNLYHAQQLAEKSYENETFAVRQQKGLLGPNVSRAKQAEGSVYNPATKRSNGSKIPKLTIQKVQVSGGAAGDEVKQLEGSVDRSPVEREKKKVPQPGSNESSNLVSAKEILKNATAEKTEDRYDGKEPSFTAVAANPGGAITDLFRNVKSARIMKQTLMYPFFTLLMKTPEEGAQTIVYCALEDDIVNGGYYQNCTYTPDALPKVACSKEERRVLMEWVRKRTHAVMEKQQSWRPKR